MTEWDQGGIFMSAQQLQAGLPPTDEVLTRDQARRQGRDFIRNFKREGVFVYRDALLQAFANRIFALELDLTDLKNTYEALHDLILKRPNEYIPMVEAGARDALRTLALDESTVPPIQILFQGNLMPTQIRQIGALDVNRLTLVPGIVINAQRTRPKAVAITIRCKNCGSEKVLETVAGFGQVVLPRTCPALQPSFENNGAPLTQTKCPVDPYVIITDKSSYIDQQTLKLQEAPETVPTGEMPRHMLLSVERTLADRIAPGTRVAVIGIVSVVPMAAGAGRGSAKGANAAMVRTPYLRVVGVAVQEEGSGRAMTSFTREEEEELRELAKQPGIYDRLAASIAPSITGDYTNDIKKAILCLLVAGSRKLLPDGMRLRGDINVLMLGDPSTAKSQFLKFVEKVAPVGVYTSGKGSSAAGLTASVIKTAQFVLEGGAMVLADGGVVCIDEFDKMREEDRVAIHEAMEQQTISVAKAGITTILNSRSAVLAAANPVYGRYDDTKSAADNIDLLPTILSRFDLIFIVRDVRNEKRDHEMALSIVNLHKNYNTLESSAASAATATTGEISLVTLKKYISYVRSKCAPRLSPAAAAALQVEYVEIRQGLKQTESTARDDRLAASEEHGVIPITVRQLEALIRLTEAVAKCSLSPEATEVHVREAVRLFHVSTLMASKSGLSSTLDLYMSEDNRKRIQALEGRIQKLLPLGSSVAAARMREQLVRAGFNEAEINTGIKIMERRDELTLVNERKTIRRNK